MDLLLPPPDEAKLTWEGFQAGLTVAVRAVQAKSKETWTAIVSIQRELETMLASLNSNRSALVNPRRARRSGESQYPPERPGVDRQDGIAGDQDVVALPEEDDVPRRVAGGEDALPVRKARDRAVRIESPCHAFEAPLLEHDLDPPTRHRPQQREDEPTVEWVCEPLHGREVPIDREGQLVGVGVDRAVPCSSQLER